MARPQLYTDDEILDKLRVHLIDNLGSVWTMHKPTWEGVKKRINHNEEFGSLVGDIVAEANYTWEKMGITALLASDEGFNVSLFKHYTMNKKAFLSHEVLELDERLKALEESRSE